MTSAAIYARVSSARQKKDETIASQTAALRAHAEQLGVELPAEWVFEDEGHSGATLVRPALERLRDVVAGVGVDVVLCYSPDRLARKFAYQALLIEEFARAGTRMEFIKGPRGDTPEDQLLVQFQGMFAEYEKAQIMERYRRGKTHRARSGSVNVLSGAPFGYRYVRKGDHAGACYEIVEHEAVLVAELFRRYAEEGTSVAELTRWLTRQGVPTRTGKNRWDRSVVWGMLRNPAYAGKAVFGKTQVVHESPGLNRTARLAGRSTPRASKTVDRPRDEWVEIPVPAIVSTDSFERVARQLADNKRYASRNSRVPSLLQGLAACAACGYGYYRTSTRTTNKKIYYYRCLGSDDYRYENGRVCGSTPVRADYLDRVVWDHITGLLADPQLIHAEIDKRLEQARTADPAAGQRKRLELALAKATSSTTRMIEAFQEQLISIDELRSRMPDLRAREVNLRGQLDAIDAQLADREVYLKLADDLDGFLAQLRDKAGTAGVEERQRVLRLLVKDVLIGPEKITIRHRIPTRERTTSSGQHPEGTDTEGDQHASCPLRWGREDAALRRAGQGVLPVAELGEHPGFEERLNQRQNALVLDPSAHPVHQGRVVDRVETRFDIRVQHPPVAAGAEVVYLCDRVMGAPLGTEPIGDRPKVGLEDGFQHQLERRLHDPVRDGRDPQLADLPGPTRFGDLALPNRQRAERAALDGGPQVVQEPGHAHVFLDVRGRQAVHAGRARPLVTCDPVERHDQRRRVVHEVEQVIEPAAGIGHRPTVKLGLHPRYPHPRPDRPPVRSIAVRRCIFRHCSLLPLSTPLPPFPMCPGSPRLGVLRRLRPAPDRSVVGAPSPSTHRMRVSRRDPERFPCSLCFARRRRSPTMPLRYRCEYAADFPRSLPGGS
jgi:site-specific DNA recombinase